MGVSSAIRITPLHFRVVVVFFKRINCELEDDFPLFWVINREPEVKQRATWRCLNVQSDITLSFHWLTHCCTGYDAGDPSSCRTFPPCKTMAFLNTRNCNWVESYDLEIFNGRNRFRLWPWTLGVAHLWNAHPRSSGHQFHGCELGTVASRQATYLIMW